MGTTKTISIAKDFSENPAGRIEDDGEFNATTFREDILIPSLKENDVVSISFDGLKYGLAYSWIEEAFGYLTNVFALEHLEKTLRLYSSDQEYDDFVSLAYEAMRKGPPAVSPKKPANADSSADKYSSSAYNLFVAAKTILDYWTLDSGRIQFDKVSMDFFLKLTDSTAGEAKRALNIVSHGNDKPIYTVPALRSLNHTFDAAKALHAQVVEAIKNQIDEEEGVDYA